MSLIINHNLMAENALRNLGGNYKKLSTSVQRLSSGLRINSAADDAAGLAIREMMRADIAAMHQGIRNAADAISLIQTAEGAMAVIDEKLTRMKELAEQSSTGTYTTAQREIINSEYQAMAAEIDRIANATNFNGVKLLDGSLANQNGGRGLKIHFGVSNNAAEDYYFINTGDVRATAGSGLRIGGDGKNDIWAQGGAARAYGAAEGCCAGGYQSLNGASFQSGTAFSFGYNWDLGASGTNGANAVGGKYTAGLWELQSDESLASLVSRVNAGSQARVGVEVSGISSHITGNISAMGVCFGDEVFVIGNRSVAETALSGTNKDVYTVATATNAGLAEAINKSSENFWALVDTTGGGNRVYVFAKEGGTQGNALVACEQVFGVNTASASLLQSAKDTVKFYSVGTSDTMDQSGVNFSLGGEKWGTLAATQNGGVWNMVLNGRDVGDGRDLWIAKITSAANSTLEKSTLTINGKALSNGKLLERSSFAEVQNAADAPWAGAEVRTQDSAQKALEAVDQAIGTKDRIRATLGAYQNRLENTISNLEIQAENLQASESRISDVDVAREVTELTKNSVLVQAAAGMVAQANSLNQLALTLIGR